MNENKQAAGGNANPTKNRYCSKTCTGLSKMRHACQGLEFGQVGVWCDHYTRTQVAKPEGGIVYRHTCGYGAFTSYTGSEKGKII